MYILVLIALSIIVGFYNKGILETNPFESQLGTPREIICYKKRDKNTALQQRNSVKLANALPNLHTYSISTRST